jgi:hypothetical protein
MGRSQVQGVIRKFLNVFIVSEVNSESEYAKGPNQNDVHTMYRMLHAAVHFPPPITLPDYIFNVSR